GDLRRPGVGRLPGGALVRLRYELDGPASEPAIALPSSLGTTLELWSENVPYWSDTFCVLSYDQPGRRTIAELGQDFLGLLDEIGIERVSYCGLSLGGATGMWLPAHAPPRVGRPLLPGPWAGPRAAQAGAGGG